MQILIYKTDLKVNRAPAWLTPTASVRLIPEGDGSVGAYVNRVTRWFGLLETTQSVRIGALNDRAQDLLAPALQTARPLRVRVVELVPSHLAPDGQARIAVSVWGDPKLLLRSA